MFHLKANKKYAGPKKKKKDLQTEFATWSSSVCDLYIWFTTNIFKIKTKPNPQAWRSLQMSQATWLIKSRHDKH